MENPKIRFKGFTKDWEQRKFGEITELKSASRVHKDEWTSNGVPFYRSSDVMTAINGTENEKAFISEELYEKLSKVSGKLEEGDILVTGGGSVGNPYIVPDNKPLYTKDADLLWIKNKGKFHPYFLYEFFFSPTFRNYLGSISHVGTIAHYTITQLSDTPISLPSFEEQKEVGEYFQSLDCLITLHQRKCEQTKKLKKYMLQKMFPQNGEKIPKIRFDGFTYDWEQRKLGDMGSTFTGLSGKTKENFGHGDAQFITYMNVFSNPVANLEMTEAVEIDAKQNCVKKGDVFFTTSSETPEEVGMSCVMPENKDNIYLNSFCFGYRPTEKFDLDYLAYVLRADSFRQEMTFLAQGISRYNISKNKVMEVSIPIPNLEEQTMVGRYFSNLDHLITLHQRKCDELKKMKKYMLQNMFI